MSKYRVFEIKDGATYWVAAPNAREAVEVYFKCLDDTGVGPDDVEEFSVEEVRGDRAKKIEIVMDYGDPPILAAELARAAEASGEPEVLGCSEWP